MKYTMYAEVKINNVWEFEQRCYIDENNTLFALLADVKNENGEVIPISFPKGFPADCSEYLSQKYSLKNTNNSFLTINEILDYNVPEHKNFNSFMNMVHHYENYTLLDIDEEEYIEDMRFVFWFNE